MKINGTHFAKKQIEKWLIGLLILTLVMPLTAGSLDWETKRNMAPVSDDSEFFLQAPVSVGFDAEDRFFLLDVTSRVIFWWDQHGKFGGTIGHPGQGPGEFSFRTRSGPQGYLAIVGEDIHVFDAGQRAVQIFDLAGQYKRSVRLNQVNGRTEAFYVLANQRYLVFNHNFMNAEPTYEVHLLDKDGTHLKTVHSVFEKDIGRPATPPTAKKIFIEAYFPAIVTAYDGSRETFILGNSGKPGFKIISLDQDTETKVTFKRIPEEVEDRDKQEFRNQSWMRRSSRFEAIFPDEMPYFDLIQPLASGEFLIYNQSPIEGRVRGLLIDRKGEVLGRMALNIGRGGGFYSTNGRLIRVLVDEAGAFQIAEVAVAPGS